MTTKLKCIYNDFSISCCHLFIASFVIVTVNCKNNYVGTQFFLRQPKIYVNKYLNVATIIFYLKYFTIFVSKFDYI